MYIVSAEKMIGLFSFQSWQGIKTPNLFLITSKEDLIRLHKCTTKSIYFCQNV